MKRPTAAAAFGAQVVLEGYSVETSKSGFGKKETDPATKGDLSKVQAILDNSKLPATAEDGKAYVMLWADGRGITAFKHKASLTRWLKKTGSWAGICWIRYAKPEHGGKKVKVNEDFVPGEQPLGIINETIGIKSFGDYAKLVAKAYEAAPSMDPKAKPAWSALIAHVQKLFKQIASTYKIEFVDDNPYPDAETMTAEVKRTKVLKIYKGGTPSPVWTNRQNLEFRAYHDYYSHIVAGTPFGVRGEIRAYNTHAKMCPPAALPALFTEIVGQACTAVVTGDFPEQKIAFLPGFDYVHLGKVDGHDIVNKEIVPKPVQQAPQAKPAPSQPAVPLPQPQPPRPAAVNRQAVAEAAETAFGVPLLEAVFHPADLDLDKVYGTFKASYQKQTGKAWDRSKFTERMKGWVLYGEEKGFVAVRHQASGPLKLVGAAGDAEAVKHGFKEVLATGKPVWGAMDHRLAVIAARMGMRMPPAWLMRAVLTRMKDKLAAANGVAPGAVVVNQDGSVTIDYPDVGKANKFIVGNVAYFKWLLQQQGSSLPATLRTAMSYFLTTGRPPPEPREEKDSDQ